MQGAFWACGGARAQAPPVSRGGFLCRALGGHAAEEPGPQAAGKERASGMPAPSMSVLMSTPLYVGSSPRSSQMDDTMLVGTRTCARMLP